MKLRLSEHPFYVLWKEGKLSLQDISNYAHAYVQLVEAIPTLWRKSLEGLGVKDELGEEIVAEEVHHISLWKDWMKKLPKPSKEISMRDVVEELESMEASELLGAIHSFEVQQPEVAKVKKDCLVKFYGFSEDELTYFDEHMNEQKHIEYARKLKNTYADKDAFEKGFQRGAEVFYRALDRFLSM